MKRPSNMSKTKDKSSEVPAPQLPQQKAPQRNAPLLIVASIALLAWFAYLIYLIIAVR